MFLSFFLCLFICWVFIGRPTHRGDNVNSFQPEHKMAWRMDGRWESESNLSFLQLFISDKTWWINDVWDLSPTKPINIHALHTCQCVSCVCITFKIMFECAQCDNKKGSKVNWHIHTHSARTLLWLNAQEKTNIKIILTQWILMKVFFLSIFRQSQRFWLSLSRSLFLERA